MLNVYVEDGSLHSTQETSK